MCIGFQRFFLSWICKNVLKAWRIYFTCNRLYFWQMTVWTVGFLANDICSALLLPWNEKSQRSSSNDNVQRNMRIENCMTKTILLMTLQTQTAWLEMEGCPKLFIPRTIRIGLCSGTQIEFEGFSLFWQKNYTFMQN